MCVIGVCISICVRSPLTIFDLSADRSGARHKMCGGGLLCCMVRYCRLDSGKIRVCSREDVGGEDRLSNYCIYVSYYSCVQ